METEANTESKKDGKIVLAWILGFFLTFIIVDAFFVYQAVSTHNGEVELIHGK